MDKTLQKTKLSSEEIQNTVVALLTHPTRDKQAEVLGISRQALYNRLVNYPEIEAMIDKLSKASIRMLQIASIKATENMIEFLDSPSIQVRLKASIEVLDRSGIGKQKPMDRDPETAFDKELFNRYFKIDGFQD